MRSEQAGRVDCLLLVLADPQCQYVKVVGKTQKEEDIFSFHGITPFSNCHTYANTSGSLVRPNSFESRQRQMYNPDFSDEPDIDSFFKHSFRSFDYGPKSGPMNGDYHMGFDFGGKFLFDSGAGKSTAGVISYHNNGKQINYSSNASSNLLYFIFSPSRAPSAMSSSYLASC
jgi:hypothetical protein